MERRRFLGALGGLSAASGIGPSALGSSAVDSSALESSGEESAAGSDPARATSSVGDDVEDAAKLERDRAADWAVAW